MSTRITAFVFTATVMAAVWSSAQTPAVVAVEDVTISGIHAAMKAGTLTCRGLVQAYLNRIDAFDRIGPALNALVVVNPEALTYAEDLDRRFARTGLTGPLHCVPIIVKDNFETIGLQSANGSLALKGYVSTRDAFQVARVKAAGAIVLAKSNMAEWAFTPYETVSSILPGYTKNPYALDRVTAGSSGGTAAAVAASFGAVGLGSDTGNSIRGPAAHQALVGIRSTMGLTSRTGVMPLNLLADIAGPMARTVEDAVAVFQVIAGEDPDDPVTAASSGRVPERYAAALVRDGLRGARIGVLRQAYESPTTDPEVVRVFEAAIADLRRAGAIIVDPAPVDGFSEIRRAERAEPCMGFRYDINRYLASRGDEVPVKSLSEIVKSRRFHPTVQRRLEQAEAGPENGPDTPACRAEMEYRDRVRGAVNAAMDAHALDAYVYPTWSNPPRLIGDLNTPHGDNSQFFSPTTGFPAVQVPMGFTRGTLPAGITFFGRAWSEATLFRLAYAYEQATHHRRPPPSTPALAAAPAPASGAERARLLAAAREIIAAAGPASVITTDASGQPQARAIDAFPPDEHMVVWFATNPRSRKVAELTRDPRVTLYYYDATTASFVSLIGRARLVDDPAEKQKRWKPGFETFWPDRGASYLLVEVTPLRIEVVSEARGIKNDPVTWAPRSVVFTAPAPAR